MSTCGIPDSSADICLLAGDTWVTDKALGPEIFRRIDSYGSIGKVCKVVRGGTYYLSPGGRPLAILRVNYGMEVPEMMSIFYYYCTSKQMELRSGVMPDLSDC